MPADPDTVTKSKSALDHVDYFSEPWEIPVVIALSILAVFLLLRSYWKIQTEREKGRKLVEQSLAKTNERPDNRTVSQSQ